MLSKDRIIEIGKETGQCSVLASDGGVLWPNKLPYKFIRAIESAARAEALEDAAKVCDEVRHNAFNNSSANAAYECAHGIRALKEQGHDKPILPELPTHAA